MVEFEGYLRHAKEGTRLSLFACVRFLLLCTRNRENRRYLRFLSSAAKSIEPIGAFARLRFCICVAPLIHGLGGCCSRCCTVAVWRRKYKRLKSLVASLEVWWCPKQILGTAEGGTRHALFASVRPCLSRAGNSSILSVACCYDVLLFAGVAVRVAVQANAVQQCLMLVGKEHYPCHSIPCVIDGTVAAHCPLGLYETEGASSMFPFSEITVASVPKFQT